VTAWGVAIAGVLGATIALLVDAWVRRIGQRKADINAAMKRHPAGKDIDNGR
jgi:hypothetical protein